MGTHYSKSYTVRDMHYVWCVVNIEWLHSMPDNIFIVLFVAFTSNMMFCIIETATCHRTIFLAECAMRVQWSCFASCYPIWKTLGFQESSDLPLWCWLHHGRTSSRLRGTEQNVLSLASLSVLALVLWLKPFHNWADNCGLGMRDHFPCRPGSSPVRVLRKRYSWGTAQLLKIPHSASKEEGLHRFQWCVPRLINLQRLLFSML